MDEPRVAVICSCGYDGKLTSPLCPLHGEHGLSAQVARLRAVNAKLLSALEAMVRHGEHDGPCTNESGDPRTPDTYEGEGCLLHWQTSEQRTVRAREAIEEANK